jgi:hypothetical protein
MPPRCPVLYPLIPGCCDPSREQSREHRGPVPSGRGRLRRSGSPRPGTDRPARARQGQCKPRPSAICFQSQIGQDCDLRLERTVQVEDASALSAVVRWEPFRTAVNGTLVARPPRMTLVSGCAVGSTLDCRVRPVLGDHPLVARVRRAHGSTVGDSNSRAPVSSGRAQEAVGQAACGFDDLSVTAAARCCPYSPVGCGPNTDRSGFRSRRARPLTRTVAVGDKPRWLVFSDEL